MIRHDSTVIDLLTMYPDARRHVVTILGELGAISDVVLWASQEQQNLDPEEGEEQEHKKYEDIAQNLFEASVRHVPSSFAATQRKQTLSWLVKLKVSTDASSPYCARRRDDHSSCSPQTRPDPIRIASRLVLNLHVKP